jgi:hypothetical protein
MKNLYIIVLSLLFSLVKISAQARTDSVIIDICSKTHLNNDLTRKVEFFIEGKKELLNTNAKIKIESDSDTIILDIKEDGSITLPKKLSSENIYTVCFCFKDYFVYFKNVSGFELNYPALWKIIIIKDTNASEEYIWQFSPNDADGWEINSKNTCS